MRNKIEFTHPDYKKIREESRRMDCTIVEDDFNTSYPNPRRISLIAGDINRYLKRKDKGVRRYK